MKVLEEANRKHEELANKRWDAQATQEKCKVEQHEADAKVRGKLLENAAVAEVQCRYVCQAEKARLAVEELQTEWEASWLPQKVHMRLGVSFFSPLHCHWRLSKVAGYHHASECGGGLIKMEGE